MGKMKVKETRTHGLRVYRRYECNQCHRRWSSNENLELETTPAEVVKKTPASTSNLTPEEIHRLLHSPGRR
jgi:transcriptional regulator NrdR family protein